MRRFVTTLATLLLVFLSFSEGFTQGVSLKIIGNETETVISDVQVILNHGQEVWTSNRNGIVVLTSRLSPNDSLTFKHIGYREETRSYRSIVNSDYVVRLDLSWDDLPPFVFTVDNRETDINRTSSEVISISPKEIHLQNPQTSADLLNVSGKVFIQKSQLGGGSPMIRGMSANRVLIVVDGIRMNNAIFRSGNIQNVISVDPNLVSGAEVLLGPGSVTYGTDAIGGVMSFRLKDPQFAAEDKIEYAGNAMSRLSSANRESTWHIDFEIRKRKISFLSSMTMSNFGDLRMGSNGPDAYLRKQYVEFLNGKDSIVKNSNPLVQFNSGYSQFNFMQKVKWQLGDSLDLDLAAYYGTTSPIPRYDRLIQKDDSGNLKYGDWYYGPQNWLLSSARLTWTKDITIADRVRFTAAYQNFKESRLTRKFQVYDVTNRRENVNMATLNLDLDKSIGKNDKLIIYYGFQEIYNLVKSSASIQNVFTGDKTATTTRYPDGSTWASTSAYFKASLSLASNWDLEAGARYSLITYHADLSGSGLAFQNPVINKSLSGQGGTLGLVYHKNGTVVRLNGSTGFRAPNIDDIGKIFDSEPGKVIVPNPDLKPEMIYSGDLSVEHKVSTRFLVQSNFFYSYLANAIVRGDISLNGQDSLLYGGEMLKTQALINAESATIYGAQIYLDYKFTSNWKATSTLNYTKGETSTGDAFRHVTPLFGATHLTYKNKVWIADLYAMYNGQISYANLAPSERSKTNIYAIDGNGNPYSPAWWTLNLKGQYRVSERLKVMAGIENILDKRYRTYSSGISAPGINFFISARARF